MERFPIPIWPSKILEALLAKVLEPNIRLERRNAVVALKTIIFRIVDINSQKGYRKT